MNTEEAKQLLERFYAGQSTAAEDARLADYFKSGDVPAELAEDGRLVTALVGMQVDTEAVPEEVSDELEQYVRRLTESAPSSSKPAKAKHLRLTRWSIAATVAALLAVGGGLLINRRVGETDAFYTTCTTEEEAVQQMARADALLAQSVRRCTVPLQAAAQQFDETTQIINQLFQ